MSMEKIPGLDPLDIVPECQETLVHIIIPLMHSSRGVVGYKNIYRGEIIQQAADLFLVIKISPLFLP